VEKRSGARVPNSMCSAVFLRSNWHKDFTYFAFGVKGLLIGSKQWEEERREVRNTNR
jgi:hypothetical protein